VNDIIKEHAMLLLEATGFRVLIPDLYKGKLGVDKEEAHHVSSRSRPPGREGQVAPYPQHGTAYCSRIGLC
jgi:hypothetical protein